MPRTIAVIDDIVEKLKDNLIGHREDVNALQREVRSQTDEVDELRNLIERSEPQLRAWREEAIRFRIESDALRKQLDDALVVLRDTELQLALVRQKIDDHLKRMDVWGGRFWGLVVILIGAVMSLASGLIAALARK